MAVKQSVLYAAIILSLIGSTNHATDGFAQIAEIETGSIPQELSPEENQRSEPAEGKQPQLSPPPINLSESINRDQAERIERPAARPRRRRGLGATFAGLSAAPSMIGDTSGGTCGSLQLGAGKPAAIVGHPTFACSRLNIAENNSALIRDRFYVSYRHFNKASNIGGFLTTPDGGQQGTLNIDRITVGLERMIADECSLELRVPINRQLTSSLSFTRVTSPSTGETETFVPIDDYDIDLGNIGLILKHELHRSQRLFISGGVAFDFPTSRDVEIKNNLVNGTFIIENPDGSSTLVPNQNSDIDAQIQNELLTISPFLAFVASPHENWFVQGFVQVDKPLRNLSVSIDATSSLPAIGIPPTTISGSEPIEIQSLGRFNLGIGRWFNWKHYSRNRRRVAITSEIHYTTTLEDAVLTEFNLIPGAPPTAPPIQLSLGNISNRNDVLTNTSGLIFVADKTTVTTAVGIPLRGGDDRGFQVEYNFSVDRRF